MSKIKKILAVVLAMAMVMAMSIVSFADEKATITIPVSKITVQGVEAGRTVTLYKLVTLNADGNEWVKNVADGYFTEADGVISLSDAEGYKISSLKDASLSDANAVAVATVPEGSTSVEFANVPVGAYLIKITDSETITYGTLIAETYKQTETYLTAEDVTVNAKPSNVKVTKTFSEGTDKVVRLGETVSFDINTVFPSFDAATEPSSRTFTVTDNPTGMKITGVTVYVGDMETAVTAGYTLKKANGTEISDLSTLTANEAVAVHFDTSDDTKYGKSVKVVVTAEVTSLTGIKNEASTDHASDTTEVEQYTAQITITKKNEDETETLEGAQFEVTKNNSTDKLYFEKVEGAVDTYRLSASGNTNASTIITASKGSVTIQGLDEGTYKFAEITAPAGYSINENGVEVTVTSTDEVNTGTGVIEKEDTLTDTKLSALPSTGGIGTTIFTVVGCLIMIAAAAMFFVIRRRTER